MELGNDIQYFNCNKSVLIKKTNESFSLNHGIILLKDSKFVWSSSLTVKLPANPNDRVGFSKFFTSGREVYDDVIKFYYDQTNELFGTDYDPPK